MKFNNVSFPHPVLGIGEDIDNRIEFTPEISEDSINYCIDLKFEHDNNTLQLLAESNQVEYYCEATCSATLFREIFKSQQNELSFEIPKKQVKGRVEFVCLLVAKDSILQYRNDNAHCNYDGYFFDLDAGEVLAYFGFFSFNADINYEKLKAVSSFMEVVENSKITYTNIDLSKSKIEIQLPSKDYEIFKKDIISRDSTYTPIFHSSIVLNALLVALYNFKEYKTTLWAQVISYRLKTDEQFESISIEDKENIPEIAQRLLGNPFERLMIGLEEINSKELEVY